MLNNQISQWIRESLGDDYSLNAGVKVTMRFSLQRYCQIFKSVRQGLVYLSASLEVF